MTSSQYGSIFNTLPEYGYFFATIKQGDQFCEVKWTRDNVAEVMAQVGGFLGTVYLINSTVLASYLGFTYDKSLMRRLYYQEA